MIDLVNVSLQFSGKYLFDSVNYKINSGDRISLVGANGTGKTSLLRIISGEIQPEEGKVLKQKRITLGYLPQENVTHKGKTLLEEAKSALTDISFLQEKENEITGRLSDVNINEEERDDLIHQLGEVHHRLQEIGFYSIESEVEKILTGLGFEAEEFDKPVETFSGGWQMRIALAKILISQNDILLMDEPTNHLDLDSLNWLISYLKSYKGALLIVSHDKRFINEITNKTLEIFLQKFYTYNGSYDNYLKYKQERDTQLENEYAHQQRKIKETERFIERFRYKSTKAKQVQSRIKQLEKINLVEMPEFKEDINIRFPVPPQSGRTNIDLRNVSKSYGEKEIFKNLNFQVERGDKIAFVGPNGAGKTTLAKIIADETGVTGGERTIGHNTLIAYYAQDVADNLNPELDVIESLDGINEKQTIGQLRTLLGSFLFRGDDVFKKVGVLSGGEKSRVALVKILLTKANFIILDEPTNHLDISSKEILQKALVEFPGSLILVSHDVDFLQPVVNKVVEIRKGNVKTYLGGIEYYLHKKESEAETASSGQKTYSPNPSINKKEQKRIEAENRQKKYLATKDLTKVISRLEKEIEELEKNSGRYEAELAAPEIYSDAQRVKEITLLLQNSKEKLQKKIAEWEAASLKLDDIEKQFS
jgi:ATP-binding cassette, subfamily F, member 3